MLSGYSYIRPLGAGGFADVFLFEQNMPKRSVAVKVLLQDVVDGQVLRMFNAEADVMARLSSHPSILTVYDASISADGRPYLVMEYCPTSPGSRYRREQIPVAEILNTAVKVACALETAHRSGVLHRDLKPSNILTTSFGAPVLADFGIASSLAGSDPEQLFAMSVPWSAPEVIQETTTGTIQTEVWAFAATIYSLLAGRTPFETPDGRRITTEQLKQRIGRARYTPIGRADVPPALEHVLAQSMSRAPGERPATMLMVAQQLQQVQVGLGIQPTPLEVAVEEWAAAGGPVDFENERMRGVMVSEVPVVSGRAPRRVRGPVRSVTDDGTRFVDAAEQRRGSRLKLSLVIGAAVIVGATATVGVLSATGVL